MWKSFTRSFKRKDLARTLWKDLLLWTPRTCWPLKVQQGRTSSRTSHMGHGTALLTAVLQQGQGGGAAWLRGQEGLNLDPRAGGS